MKLTLTETRRPLGRALGLLALWPLFGALAQTPKVASLHDQYLPEAPIVIGFSGGPGNKKDWIGVYPDGEIPDGNPGSTIWNYVDGTQAGNTGFTEGNILFPTGLAFGGNWKAFLLKNDGYEILAETSFTVLEVGSSLLHVDKRTYQVGEAISVTFTNGPANAKDWVGIYPAGVTPDGDPGSTIWNYVDGTQGGATGLAAGTVAFPGGLSVPGDYVAFLLRDDGYEVISSESFTVAAPATVKPRVLSLSPANNSANLPPVVPFRAAITNGSSQVVTASLALVIDGAPVTAATSVANDLVSVTYTNQTLYAANSTHTYKLTFQDNAAPANSFVNEGSFTIGAWQDIVLPAPLFLETFDTTVEGQLPAGWSAKSYSAMENPEFDLGDLNSASYANWVVVNVIRFEGAFVTYSNPDNPESWETDYRRVLTGNPFNVVNGQAITGPLASGRMVFGDSGYRNGASQVLFLYSPDFNLTGKTDVQLVFNSLWEQNQDSIAAVEYSIDAGASWLPVAYLLDAPDVVRAESGDVDAEATLTTERSDIARYTDDGGADVGGTYGAFIAAPISPALAPFIQARIDNDTSGSKRIEKFRLPQADNQAKVRLRFAHAGTDSWYWGLDNVGLYSIPSVTTPATVSIGRNGDQVTVSWTGSGVLKATASLASPQWEPVPNVTGNSIILPVSAASQFFRVTTP